jgi:hypothetical protein
MVARRGLVCGGSGFERIGDAFPGVAGDVFSPHFGAEGLRVFWRIPVRWDPSLRSG